ncbi:MAG: aminotransferase class IV [Chloroflexi bacterium]|nr:aminotransferase class IV [Chloroflexota bacterium]
MPIGDRGFTLGDGLFETMRAQSGRVTNLQLHLARLFEAAHLIALDIPFGFERLSAAVDEALQANALREAYIRLTISRGLGGPGVGMAGVCSPTVAIVTKRFEPYPANLYATGMRVKTVSIRRNPTSPISRVKSLSYLDNVLAKAEAVAGGAQEALMLNTDGYVACGSVSNVFFLRRESLVTPSLQTGILPGITRSIILELAPLLNLEVKEKLVLPTEVMEMEAAFLTNTLMGVMPLTWLDGRSVGSGEVHPTVRRLGEMYEELVSHA